MRGERAARGKSAVAVLLVVRGALRRTDEIRQAQLEDDWRLGTGVVT